MAEIRQVWEIETQQAEAAARRVEEAVTASADRAVKATERVDQAQRQAASSGEGIGTAVGRGSVEMQKALRRATTVASAFGLGLSAAVSGAEQSFVSLAGTIVAAFASGNVVVGAITAVAGAIGLLTGKTKDAARAESEWAREREEFVTSTERMLTSLDEMEKAATRALLRVRGFSDEQQRLLEIEEELATVNRSTTEGAVRGALLERERATLERVLGIKRQIADEEAKRSRFEESQRAMDRKIKDRADAERAAVDTAERSADSLERQLELRRRIVTEGIDPALAALEQEFEQAIRTVAVDEQHAEAIRRQADAIRGLIGLRVQETEQARETARAEEERLRREADKKRVEDFLSGGEPIEKAMAFASQAASITQGALSDGITDGIFDGFKNGGEILEQFGRQLTQTVIDALLEATIGQATRNLFLNIGSAIFGSAGSTGAAQFGALVTRPSVYRVAEHEPERIIRDRDLPGLVRALAGAGGGGSGGGTINIYLKPTELGPALAPVIAPEIRDDVRAPKSVVEVRQFGW